MQKLETLGWLNFSQITSLILAPGLQEQRMLSFIFVAGYYLSFDILFSSVTQKYEIFVACFSKELLISSLVLW